MDDLDARYARLLPGEPLPTDRAVDRPLGAIESVLLAATRASPSGFAVIEDGMRLRGTLDVPSLQRAIQLLTTRYDVLRHTYPDGAAVARIAPHVTDEALVIDCSSGGEAMAIEVSALERDRPIDLQRAPLSRFVLLRLSATEHWLYHFGHHLVGDGRAHVLLDRDLGEAYRAYKHGQEPQLRAPGLQYRDVVAWEHAWRTPEVDERYRAFWRTQLSDAPTPAPIAAMRPRPPAQLRFRCDRAHLDLTPDEVRPLTRLIDERGWSLPGGLLSGLVRALHAEGSDALVAIFSGNRRRENLTVVGNFATMIPVRVPRREGETRDQVFTRTTQAFATALRYQDLTPTMAEMVARTPAELAALLRGEAVSAESHPERACRVVFNYWGMRGATLELEGIEITELDADEKGRVIFDIEINCSLTEEDGIRVFVEYNGELIDPPQMERFLRGYRDALVSP